MQRPLIKAIGKLHPRDDKHRILDGIREILFSPLSGTAPFLIDMLFIRDERDDAPVVNAEDGAKLAEWMKRAIIKAFLDWLVATLNISPDKEGRISIDVLTGKSRLTDYPGDYQKGQPALEFGELLEILQKNKSKLGVKLVEGSSLLGEMRGRYGESLERVLPLKEQLSKTDRLIDAVVYRLYGLTEEEIKLVEGKA